MPVAEKGPLKVSLKKMEMNILFVKLSALGDVIMALSSIPALKRKYPDARLTWITGKSSAPLIRRVGEIDEIIEVDEKSLLTGRLSRRIAELIKVMLRLNRRQFDMVLTAHSDKRYKILTMTVRAKLRRSFNWQEPFPRQGRHHCDEYVRLATGIEGPGAELPQFPSISGILSGDFAQNLDFNGDRPVVAVAPGGAKNVLREQSLKRWPIENYIILIKTLLKRNIHVAVTGDNNDSWIRPYLESLPVKDLIGKTSLLELIEVYKTADLVVTHDSGPMHMAIFAGTPVLSLFGPTMPQVFGPLQRHISTNSASARSKVIWGGESLPCRPCYNGKSFSQCDDNLCLRSISPETVMQRIDEMLNEKLCKNVTANH